MRRIRCTAPGLAALSYLPGQDVMLTVPTPAGPSFRRRYTIRSFDPDIPAIDIDMVLHGDGPAAAWAASARPGSRIEGDRSAGEDHRGPRRRLAPLRRRRLRASRQPGHGRLGPRP